MKWFTPVLLDGLLYAAIGLFTYLNTEFGTDEAAKYVAPLALFWLRASVGGVSATLLAVKMYRSTTFAEYRVAKNGSYHAPDKDDFAGNKQNKEQNENKTNTSAVSSPSTAGSL